LRLPHSAGQQLPGWPWRDRFSHRANSAAECWRPQRDGQPKNGDRPLDQQQGKREGRGSSVAEPVSGAQTLER
jgi:hypothetical protein